MATTRSGDGTKNNGKRPTLKVDAGKSRVKAPKRAIKPPRPVEPVELIEESDAASPAPATPLAKPTKIKAKKGSKEAKEGGRPRALALAIAEAALDKKATHVEVIDVRGRVDYADYVVVMSGSSDRQVNAIAKHVEEALRTKEKARCLGVEGLPQASWVLMDFGDVVVHIFHEDTRGYYDLETLWSDASRLPVA